MGKITQYRPNFVSGFENDTAHFNSTDELFEIPFVKNFKNEGTSLGSKFFQFSQDEYSVSQPEKRFVLLAEYDCGKLWYVVGFTDDNEIIKTLPKWVEK